MTTPDPGKLSMRLRSSALLSLAGLLFAGGALAAQAPADLVAVNGKVFTADGGSRVVEAFAVDDGKYVAVGTNAEARAYVGRGTRVLDLGGRFVSPGLSDGHFHSEGGGPGVDLSRVSTLAELYAAIAAQVAKTPAGELITTNSDWHEMQLQERRLPTAQELDVVAPNHPVVVIRGGHSYILNTAALRKWNVTKEMPDPPGGRLGRLANGELNGELIDTARRPVTLPPQPPAGLDDIRLTQKVLNSYGMTAVRVTGGGKTDPATLFRMTNQLKDAGELTLRYNILLRAGADPIAAIEATGLKQDQGDAWVKIGGVKLGVDGGFEGGHMHEPYLEPYGEGGTYYGVVTSPPEQYTAVVKALNQRGFRIASHAAGDAAVEQVLDAYERANDVKPIAGERWAIEHAFITTPAQRARAKALGLIMSVQDHLFVAGPAFKLYIGEARANRITPLKSYLEAGLAVTLGTDSPVIPVNPFWNLYHYVTRETRSDGVYGPNERILDRAQLLKVMTMGFATATEDEAVLGSVEPGKLADFVVMSDDFLTVPAERIKDMKALATFVGGREVYRDASWR
jgi:predicted amidohydrolase YtcJ